MERLTRESYENYMGKLPGHPGMRANRIAAGASPKDDRIYFTGGHDNPYNYNGNGYNASLRAGR